MSIKDYFQSSEYRAIQQEHIYKTVNFLKKNSIEFSLVSEMIYTNFSPRLPDDIMNRLPNFPLFILSGYTFETLKIDKESIEFEAGFGEINFGSNVQIPLLGIKHIFVGEIHILENVANPAIEKETLDTKNSMEALLSNPENLKLLRKKIKK